MKYQVSTKNGITTANINGQMTFDHRADGAALAAAATAEATTGVVLDMSGVDYIDSAGLGILLTVNERAMNKKVGVILKGASGSVREILELACFDTIFTFEA